MEKINKNNIFVINTNSMKYLTNYIKQNELEKIFICFPDPNFKKSHFKRRLVNKGFLSEYAYVLKNFGRVYFVTDVEEYFLAARETFLEHSLFRRVEGEEGDPFFGVIFEGTEEGQRVSRNGGRKFGFVFECVKEF